MTLASLLEVLNRFLFIFIAVFILEVKASILACQFLLVNESRLFGTLNGIGLTQKLQVAGESYFKS